jgi:hypothetical protein
MPRYRSFDVAFKRQVAQEFFDRGEPEQLVAEV